MVIAILLAGGTGIRLGSNIPKQYIEVAGKPLISYSIRTLMECEEVQSIRVVADEVWHELICCCFEQNSCNAKFAGFSKPGENRQLSIWNALEDIRVSEQKCEYVLIHDAARPFLRQDLLKRMFDAVGEAEGVLPVLPMKDTVYFCEDGQQITGLLDRSKLFAGQAPELFRFSLYYDANKRILGETILTINGSTEVAVKAGMRMEIVAGDENNFKVTTKEDLERAARILMSPMVEG